MTTTNNAFVSMPGFIPEKVLSSQNVVTILLLLVFLSVFPSVHANVVAGAIKGDFAVSQNGAATYSIPIEVPPGVNGLQPKLSLVYNSQGRNGLLGMGWSLGGLSVIHRCAATIEQDGFKGGINFDANDRYCLDGQRLIEVGTDSIPLYGSGTGYRTEVESYSKIIGYGSQGSGHAYFVVQTKSGQIIEYANDVAGNSRIETNGPNSPSVRIWAINKLKDAVGNEIIFDYIKDVNNGKYRASSISYANGQRHVNFFYEDRADGLTLYVGGGSVKSTKRLSSIQTISGVTTVRDYQLTYQQGVATERSRLDSIQECAGSSCFNPVTFQYQDDERSFSPNQNGFNSLAPFDVGRSADPMEYVDVNGDGLVDYCRAVGATGVELISCALNTGSGFGDQYGFNSQTSFDLGRNDLPKQYIDVNGDGLVDYCRSVGADGNEFISCALNTGSGFGDQYGFNSLAPFDVGRSADPMQYVDVNGDGLVDYCRAVGATGVEFISCALNTGNGFGDQYGFNSQTSFDLGYSSGPKQFVDVNGDGMADYCRAVGATGVEFLSCALSTGSGFGDQYGFRSPVSFDFGYSNFPRKFIDVNGDGLVDYCRTVGAEGSEFISCALNTGTGFGYQYEFSSLTPFDIGRSADPMEYVDINSDGLVDYCRAVGATGSEFLSCALNTGSGFGYQYEFNSQTTFDMGRSDSPKIYVDVNGDGTVDYCRAVGADGSQFISCVKGMEVMPDLLSSVNDSLGNNTTIHNKPLTDSAVYAKDTAPPPFQDVLNIQSPMYVVSSYDVDNGIGGVNTVSYKYGGAKSHRLGRGFLGFRWQEITQSTSDPNIDITTRTEYLQDPASYEYIGRAATSEVRLSDNTLIQHVDYTYGTLTSDAGMRYPYLAQSVESKYETDGSLISTVTNTTSGYDLYGNPRYTTISTTDGTNTYTRQTDSTITNDPTNWRLGVVTNSTVTNTIPGKPAESRESSFTYDATNGLLVSETIEPNNPNLWVTTTYEYDLNGNKTKSTITGADLMEPRVTTTSYDLVNNQFPSVLTNAEGHSETRVYDERFGTISSLTGPNNLTTTATFDGFGRTTGEYRADGTSTITTYGIGSDLICPSTSAYAINYVKSVRAGAAPVVIYYDKRSREVQRCSIGFGGSLVYKDTEYDAQGNVWRVSRNYFSGSTKVWTTYSYDVLGRVKTETIDGVAGNTSYTYAGRTTSVTNPASQTSRRTVNALGELITVTDALNNSVTYEYDPFGNLDKVTDAMGNEIRMDYNIRGHKIWMDDPDMGYWDYGYNVLGELLWQRDAKLQTTTMQYDKLGRMVVRIDGDGTTTWAYDTTPSGNGIGKLYSVTRPEDGYSKTYSYDQYGREQSVTTTILNLDTEYTMNTSYTADGQVDTITYPLGTGATPFAVQNIYDANGYLERVQKSDSSVTYWTANTVNADGQVTWETLGNTLDTLRSYDSSTGLVSAISTGSAGNVQSLSYSFDAVGNLTQRIDDNQGYTENFLYDDLNRLTSAELVEFATTTTFQYDAIGNITYKSDVGSYAYPASGANSVRPHAVTSAGGSSYSYDENGNMTSGGGKTLSYTSYNKPYDIQSSSGYSTFGYAPDRGRIVQTSSEGVTIYLKPVSNSNTVYEKEIKNNVVTHKYYIYGGSGMVAVHQDRDNSTFDTRYFHMDHLGSIDAITDESGAVVKRKSYDAFGKQRVVPTCAGGDPICQLDPIITNLGFTGHESLPGVGLIHMNGRVYDPLLGRFLAADPHIQSKNPQNLNRYTYVNNNPLSSTDPSGFFFKKLFKALKKVVKKVAKAIARVVVVAVFTIVGFVASGFNPAGAVAGFYGGMQAVISYNRGMSIKDSLIMGAYSTMQAYSILQTIQSAPYYLDGAKTIYSAFKNKMVTVRAMYNRGVDYLEERAKEWLINQAKSKAAEYLKSHSGLFEAFSEGYRRYLGGESWGSVIRGSWRTFAKIRAKEKITEKTSPLFVDYVLARSQNRSTIWFRNTLRQKAGTKMADEMGLRREFRDAFAAGFSDYDEKTGVQGWDGHAFRGSLYDSVENAIIGHTKDRFAF